MKPALIAYLLVGSALLGWVDGYRRGMVSHVTIILPTPRPPVESWIDFDGARIIESMHGFDVRCIDVNDTIIQPNYGVPACSAPAHIPSH